MKKPVVAIIGRPNVGKSTLYNRIIRKRDAIVDDQPGVTRDRKYADAEWSGFNFTLIDTGGYLPDTENLIHQAVYNQVHQAVNEADVIVLVADVVSGITSLDSEVANIIKKSKKQAVLAVNKVDNQEREYDTSEFYKLGLGDPVPISALGGRNIGDFLDKVIDNLPVQAPETADDESEIKIAVVGKPNVGKSSFVNAILGKDKLIVTNIPGTTRDAIDTPFSYHDQNFLLIDTAGLRKKAKVKESVEYFSTIRTISSIQRCDIAVILIDAVEGITDQDKKVLDEAVKFKKGIIIAVNKWDLIEKDTYTAQKFETDIKDEIPFINYIPILFISALTKQRIFKIIDIAKSIHGERGKKISTSTLNNYLEPIMKQTTPAAVGGKEIKIKYITQIKSAPPVFAFFCNHPNLIKSNYKSFLEKKIREQFGFFGIPITLLFRRK
ncbi:ribosome biogenesis GTPase Der [candidate division KSB1 bacterium 4572_119]|nr:MAG: ribosome biogenesis GTPase Der [candidate division KSB1 bacterium 4572_119]